MDAWGYVIIAAGAIVLAVAMDYAVRARLGYEAVLTAIGAGLGGFVASEWLGGLSNWGMELYGVRVFPALIGAIIVGLIVEAAVAYQTRRAAT